jgi:hypothetical protein
MKRQSTLTKTLIQAAVVLVASAVASPAGAQTVALGDINNDGLMDVAAITSPTTITISLANLFGGYTVSAILSVPKSQQIANFELLDLDGDGDLDVYALGLSGGGLYGNTWLGNGDGTFGSRTTIKSRFRGIW